MGPTDADKVPAIGRPAGDHRSSRATPPSIYEHVMAHARPDGIGLSDAGYTLPDESLLTKPGEIGFAPGAREGILRNAPVRSDESATATRVKKLHRVTARVARRPNERRFQVLVELFAAGPAREVAARLAARLAESPPRNLDALYPFIRRLFLATGDREVLKFAIALLALWRRQEDLDLFRTIALHEEFTSYAVRGMSAIAADLNLELMRLARALEGWGKIGIIERLLQVPRDDVRSFLLQEGCGADVLDGYVALAIAETCHLRDALAKDGVDVAVMSGAGKILETLARDAVEGGPDGDLLDYEDGGRTVERFMELFEHRAETLEHFRVVDAVREFLEARLDEEKLRSSGWDADRRGRVLAACHRIKGRPEWNALVNEGLRSLDEARRSISIDVAKALGLPLHDYLVTQLDVTPTDARLWFELVWGCDEAGIEEALAIGRRRLLQTIEQAVGTQGAERRHLFQVSNCLISITQELARFPGKGGDFLILALRSPVVADRNMALRALQGWNPGALTPEMLEEVRRGLDDPRDSIRENCRRILERLPRC